ncbi:MAG: hypothetical protein GY789_12350 [Hyphomicrobiales bacterium]|nr:hypothetical protein [Hyphomicrobiales bacterium]MCP5000606.1 hypothetical protein [Hyphomicrobiales bacterium]
MTLYLANTVCRTGGRIKPVWQDCTAVVFHYRKCRPAQQAGKIAGPIHLKSSTATSLHGWREIGPSAPLHRLPDAPHRAVRRAWPNKPIFRHQLMPFKQDTASILN